MAILNVKYRDISFEEATEEHKKASLQQLSGETREHWESKLRGRAISIETPPASDGEDWCGQPWYRIVGGVSLHSGVCSHLAEIGD